MPIESFYEMLVIDTPEAAARLVAAFEAAEKRGPYVPKYDLTKLFSEGRMEIPEFEDRVKRRGAEMEQSGESEPE